MNEGQWLDVFGAVLLVALLVGGIAGVRLLMFFQKCPLCRSTVPNKATRCRHCGADLP